MTTTMNVPFHDAVLGLKLAAALERITSGWYGLFPAAEWDEVRERLDAHGATWIAQQWGGGLTVFASDLHCEAGPFAFPATGRGLAEGFRTGLPACDRLEMSADRMRVTGRTAG